jgi:tripartite-type tricarboxylate transporter receptor subunit TctC
MIRATVSATIALGLIISSNTTAQTYPTRAVTVIVPQSPGGANDTVARIVLAKLSEALGQQFVVENRPGAGGNLGTQQAAKAPKDGYTLMLTVGSAHTINPALYKNAGFDPIKDFELAVNANNPAKTVAELVAWIKAQPGTVNYASAGNGTLNHLFAEMFKQSAGINLVHIPYKAAAASVTDVVNGTIPMTFASLPAANPFARSGKLRLLGVASEKRTALLPDVPTIGETLKGFGATSWYGLFAPAGTPRDIVAKLATEVAKVVAQKDTQDRLAVGGGEPMSTTPDEFAALIRAELPRWAAIVKASGATVD